MRTARLDLLAATLAHVTAELEAPERLPGLLGAVVPASWPPGEYDRDAMAFFRERLLTGGAVAVGWYGWYALSRPEPGAEACLIGAGGYFGPPTPDGFRKYRRKAGLPEEYRFHTLRHTFASWWVRGGATSTG